MKKIQFYVFVMLFINAISCKIERVNKCDYFKLDFSYSISYAADSGFAFVCYSDASSGIPNDCEFEWKINGNSYRIGESGEAIPEVMMKSNCPVFRHNGNCSIVMTVITPEGIRCSISKDFEITGIK